MHGGSDSFTGFMLHFKTQTYVSANRRYSRELISLVFKAFVDKELKGKGLCDSVNVVGKYNVVFKAHSVT